MDVRTNNIPVVDWLKDLKRPPDKSPGRRVEDIYSLGPLMGRGATAAVLSCKQKKTGQHFAVKVIDKKETSRMYSNFEGSVIDRLKDEIEISMNLSHRNIIDIKDVFETKRHVWIIMEMMKGGELFDYLFANEFLFEHDAMSIVQQITAALAYMHHHKVIHRDLKLENIMLRRPVSEEIGSKVFIKLIDFGMSKELDHMNARTGSVLGSPGYVAPEILKRQKYTSSVDMYSLGVITYSVLCGYMPMQARVLVNFGRSMRTIVIFPKKEWKDISGEAQDFVRRLLSQNPDERMTAVDALEHPWLRPPDAKKGLVRRTSSLFTSKNMKTPLSRIELDQRKKAESLLISAKWDKQTKAYDQNKEAGITVRLDKETATSKGKTGSSNESTTLPLVASLY